MTSGDVDTGIELVRRALNAPRGTQKTPKNPEKITHNAQQAAWADSARAQMLAAEARARAARAKRAVRTPPRATGPATGFRAQHALPPPHMRLTREDLRRDALQRQKCRRDGAYFPAWLLRLTARIHGGHREYEIAQLPANYALRLRKLNETCVTEHQKNSIAALAISAFWLANRARGRVGRTQNIAGLPQGLWARLTRSGTGQAYSVNRVFGGWHGRAAAFVTGPRGGRVATDVHQTGFARLLEQAGLLRVWIPPADAPAWMCGESGYACAILRPLEAPVDASAGLITAPHKPPS